MRKLATVFLSMTVTGCDGGAGDVGDAGEDRPPVIVASEPYTLQPGEEKYYCYTTITQEDLVVEELAPTYGNGTHHIILAQSLVGEPEGFAECDVLFKNTWIPMFLGGKGTSPVKFPAGAGYKIPRGTPLVMQLHLQNPNDVPVTDTASVAIKLLDPTAPFTPAGIFGLDNRAIKIPALTSGHVTEMTCDSHGKTLDVFSTLAHMHKLGRHVRVTRNSDVIYEGDWDFDQQLTVPKTITITPTDAINLTCRFDNPTGVEIGYGESSDDEMCAFVLYYTPFEALDGCIKS